MASKRVLAQAGQRDIRFHDRRPYAAGSVLQQGIHPKVGQERLGQPQINIALDIDSHVLPGLQDQAAAKMESLIAIANVIGPGRW
jgi:integrase